MIYIIDFLKIFHHIDRTPAPTPPEPPAYMKAITRALVASGFLASSGTLLAQSYYDLDFSNHVQATNATYSGLGAYYTGDTFDFLNVAPTSGQSIDLRASVSNVSSNTSWLGAFPDYSSNTGQPDGDLGYLYQANSAGVGGITYNLSFYQGGGTFTENFVVPDFRLMIYDVDGESTQSESVRVNVSQGFYGYRLPSVGGITVTDEGNGNYLFTGPGVNRSETDPSAAFILYFRNTSQITLNMLSTTTESSPLPNGVFSAIDGDLSMLAGDLSSFGDIVTVPEPASASLALLGAAGFLVRRRRA